MNLEDQSRAMHKLASEAAKNAGRNWNKVYLFTLWQNGFDLIEIAEGQSIGQNGPLQAPHPAEDNFITYATPCVIAPKGWTPP
jgi:hypothetical protein